MISVSGISKSFGEVEAVRGISFDVQGGQITGLLGPNGAGKTTTLRMLTCYLRPDGGTITVDGLDTAEDSIAVRRKIGYLPESVPLYEEMVVFDYVGYVAAVHGVTDPSRVRETAALCGITEVMHKRIGELSKGYRQRVGLAHAMIPDPDILVLDEPTSGLDPNQIIEIRNLIREIGKRKTVILSTHILSEVEATCDRVIIINEGRIVADDSTENLQAGREKDKRITLRVGGASFAQLRDMLRGIDPSLRVEKVPDRDLAAAMVLYSGGRDIRPDIYGAVKSNKDWVLYEMKLEQFSLEEIFRQLTIGGEHVQQ